MIRCSYKIFKKFKRFKRLQMSRGHILHVAEFEIGEPGEYKGTITNLKCYDEGENIRLTFNWGAGVEQVYIFENEDKNEGDASPEVNQNSGGRLFTLQEYKKRGGYIRAKRPGRFTYRVYPFVRDESGRDILSEQPENSITHICKTDIALTIEESTGVAYKHYKITLTAQHSTPPDIVLYVKYSETEDAHPGNASDGVAYLFGEMLDAGKPVTRIIRTETNEYLRFFINQINSELYNLTEKT